MNWTYERLDENGNVQHCPAIDADGSVTGRIVVNVKAWFDENPEERIARGWVKHLTPTSDEIKEAYDWDPQSQMLVQSTRVVDEHTVEDVFHVIDKSEEAMLMEEIFNAAGLYVPTGHVILDGHGGVIV